MASQKDSIRQNIRNIYLFEIANSVFFAVPIMVLFWQNNGMSLFEVMILQSLYAIMALILEIPTGYFADRYGRKRSLVLAGICSLFAIVVYSLGTNFWYFLLAEMFFAFRSSFISGSNSALLYDTLLEYGEEKQYKKYWGNLQFAGLVSLALANIAGGFIASYDLRWTLLASIPFFALSIPFAWNIREPSRDVSVEDDSPIHAFQALKAIIFQHKNTLLWLIIYSGVIHTFNQSALWFYQPYFTLTGVDIAYFGIIFGGFQVFSAISAKYAYKIEQMCGKNTSLVLLVVLVTGSYFLMSNFLFLFSFSFCFIQQFVRGFRATIVSDYINTYADSRLRATILSVDSFVGKLGYAALIPIFGWIADILTLPQALGILGICSGVVGVVMLLILRNQKVL